MMKWKGLMFLDGVIEDKKEKSRREGILASISILACPEQVDHPHHTRPKGGGNFSITVPPVGRGAVPGTE